jgi:hypothetical protein
VVFENATSAGHILCLYFRSLEKLLRVNFGRDITSMIRLPMVYRITYCLCMDVEMRMSLVRHVRKVVCMV